MKKIYLVPAATLLLLASYASMAQIDSCNVFLKGNHLEIGIDPTGTIGSSVMQPAGYHGNQVHMGPANYVCNFDGATMRLGMVSDPKLTGWTNYYGDFITSAYNCYCSQLTGTTSTYESYLFTINDSTTWIENSSQNTAYVPGNFIGSNVSYSNTGGVISTTYINSFDSVNLTQVVTLDTGALYANFQITLTNTATTPRNNLKYARVVYTNNDYVQTDSFGSVDTIVYNCPAHPYSLVVSRGKTDTGAYVALGTADTSSRCFIDSLWPMPIGAGVGSGSKTLTNVYNENFDTSNKFYYSGSKKGEYAIGLVFSIPHLATVDSASDSVARTTSLHPANSVTFNFFYSTSTAASNEALGITSSTTGIANVSGTNIKAYPNPATGLLTVAGLSHPDATVSVTDITGRYFDIVSTPLFSQL